MPKTKLSMIFNSTTLDKDGQGFRQGGWSESWYTDLTPSSTAFEAAFESINSKRAALLPANTKIIAQRVQQVDPAGVSRLYEKTYVGGSSSQNDLPQVALLWQMRSTAGFNHRPVILRGVPDARVVTGEYSPTSAYNNNLSAFFNELMANWQMKGRVRTHPAVPIQSIGAEGVYILKEASDWAANDFVRLLRCRNQFGHSVRGRFQVVTAPNTRNGTIAGYDSAVLGTIANGKMRKDETAYFAITLLPDEVLDPLAITRKVGRPFFAFHGRRSAKR